MKNIKRLLIFSMLFLLFLFSGCCSRESTECNLINLAGQESSQVSNRFFELTVDYEVTTYDFNSVAVISKKASLQVYKDQNLKNKVDSVNLQVGMNTYYLKVIAENDKYFNSYQVNIKRLNRYTVTFTEGENYYFKGEDGGEVPTYVDEGQDLSFKVETIEQYDMKVFVNGVLVTPRNGVYTYISVHTDLTVNVSLTTKTFTVTYPNYNKRIGYSLDACDINSILPESLNYGDNLCFRVNINPNYKLREGGSIVVKSNDQVLTETGLGIYVDDNVKENIIISVDNSDIIKETVNLTYTKNEAYKLVYTLSGEEVGDTLNKGENASLTIAINEGYIGSVSVSIDGEAMPSPCTPNGGCSYTIDVKKDVNIEIDSTNLRKANHNVQYSVNGFCGEIIANNTESLVLIVADSSSFSFKVKINEGYEGTYTVSANNEILTAINGVYTVNDVKEDIYVLLDVSQMYLRHNIEYPFQREGYEILAADEVSPLTYAVEEGATVSFYVRKLIGYNGTFKVYANNQELEAENNLYTISDINEDIVITVDASLLIKQRFTITYPSVSEKYIITKHLENELNNIGYGENLYFVVSLNEGYEGTYVVGSDNGEVTCNQNVCLLENITTNIAITIDDSLIKVIVFDVNYPSLQEQQESGYLIKPVLGGELVNKVNYKESLSFIVEIDEEYYVGTVEVRNGIDVLGDVNGVYTINNVKKVVNIIVETSNLQKITYAVNYNTGSGYKVVDINGNNLPTLIEKGEVLTFKVVILESHEGTLSFSINEGENIVCSDEVQCGYYSVGSPESGVSGVTNIVIDNSLLNIKTHSISYVFFEGKQDGVEIVSSVGGSKPIEVEYGQDLTFKINLIDDYKGNIVVGVADTFLTPSSSGVYTYENVKEDISLHIDATGLYVAYNVILPTSMVGYQILNIDLEELDLLVLKNANLQFKVNVLEGYQGTITVYVNDVEVMPSDGVYLVSNVTADVTISVISTLQILTFEVTYPQANQDDLYIIEDTSVASVDYGSNLALTINLKEGYEGEIVVTAINGETSYEVTKQNNVYTILNIKSAITIGVNDANVTMKNLSITYPTLQVGYQIVACDEGGLKTSVLYNQSVCFEVEYDENYSGTLYIKRNGEVLLPTNEQYIMQNIKENVVVSVDTTYFGWTIYDVNYENTEKYQIVNLSNQALSNKVNKGSDLKFKVNNNEGYFGNVVVYINDNETPLPSDDNGVYSLGQISGNINITVNDNGVDYRVYNVSFTTITGFEFTNVDEGSPLPSKIIWHNSLEFKAGLIAGYQGSYLVHVNNERVSPNANGVYTVSNVENDLAIKVTSNNISKITYSLSNVNTEKYSILYSSNSIEYGEDLTFRVTYTNNYDGNRSTVKNNNLPLRSSQVNGNEYTYVFENITTAPNITVDAIRLYYVVYFPSVNDGYELEYSSTQVNHNDAYSFTVRYLNGYDYNNAVVKYNNTVIYDKVKAYYDVNGYKYTINNVRGDLYIDIAVPPYVYNITYTSGQGYEFKDKVFQVSANNSLSFAVEYNENYDYENALLQYKKDGIIFSKSIVEATLDPENNLKYIYTIDFVSSNLDLSIDIERIKYNIEFIGKGYNPQNISGLSAPLMVNKGENYEFKLEIKNEFIVNDLKVYFNETTTLTKDIEGIYTIYHNNINNDFTITVTGLEQGSYATLDYGKQEGYTISALSGYTNTYIELGSNFKFTINPKEGYNINSITVTHNNIILQKDGEGVYTINNITESDKIVVNGVVKNSNFIEFVGAGAKIYDENGLLIFNYVSVYYNDNFKFRVEKDEAYSGALSIQKDGATITPNQAGYYELNNIKTNVIINIQGVQIINYNVSYTNESTFTFVPYMGQSSLPTTLAKGSSLKFGVKINDAYQAGENYYLTYADKKISTYSYFDESNYIYYYEIRNINSAGNVQVYNLEPVEYVVDFQGLGEMYDILLLNIQNQKINRTDTTSLHQIYKFKIDTNYWDLDSLQVIKIDGTGSQNLSRDSNGYYYFEVQSRRTRIGFQNLVPNNYYFKIYSQGGTLLYNKEELRAYEVEDIKLAMGNNHTNYTYYLSSITNENVLINLVVSVKGNTIIYAKPNSSNYTITFKRNLNDLNPYIVEGNNETNINWNEKAIEIDAFANKGGYIFTGWGATENAERKYKVSEQSYHFNNLKTNTILYANYIENFKITLDSTVSENDKIIIDVNQTNYKNYVSIMFNNINVLKNKYPGFILMGWYKDSNFENIETSFYYDDDVILYAKWTHDFHVHFNTLGKGEVDSLLINNSNYNTQKYLPQPTYNNYLFIGWYLDSQYKVEVEDNFLNNITNDVTLYAKWIRCYSDNASYLNGTWKHMPLEGNSVIVSISPLNGLNYAYEYITYNYNEATGKLIKESSQRKEIYYIGNMRYVIKQGAKVFLENNILYNPSNNTYSYGDMVYEQIANVVVTVYGESAYNYLASILSDTNGYLNKSVFDSYFGSNRYYYIGDPNEMNLFNFSNKVQLGTILRVYNKEIKMITFNYIDEEGNTIKNSQQYISIYNGVENLGSASKEGATLLYWTYEGKIVKTVKEVLRYVLQKETVPSTIDVVANFYEHIDYSGDDIIGNYLYAQNEYVITFYNTGLFKIQDNVGFWYKEEEVYFVNLQNEVVEISFVKGNTAMEDIVIIQGAILVRM